MKLEDIMIDSEAQSEGRWIRDIPDCDDLELLVRGLDCAEASHVRRRRLERWSQGQRLPEFVIAQGPPQSVRDEALTDALVHVVLRDWRNLTIDGEPVPYSVEMARRLVAAPENRAFRLAVLWAADLVGKSEAYVARRRAA
ncbi:MAG: hypothetical protein B7Z40_20095 [Bosea sp. 12-68-7]|nr:MAG: hypothetical protein B7Z40_20095 [Bosea sp. 12-68-7]